MLDAAPHDAHHVGSAPDRSTGSRDSKPAHGNGELSRPRSTATVGDDPDAGPPLTTLSAAAVERFLGLPPGAWKRRHLFALRVLGPAFAGLGLNPGDHLIVEPGPRMSPTSLVLVRTRDELAIQRVARDADGRTVLAPPDPTTLPFPTADRRAAVVGTVLGMVPADLGTGPIADRRDRAAATRRHGRSTAASGRAAARQRDYGGVEAPISPVGLRLALQNWRRWMARAIAARPAGPRRLAHWRALEARLGTLLSCLEVTAASPLRHALAREGEMVLRAMQREARAENSSAAGRPHLGDRSRIPSRRPATPEQGSLFVGRRG
jgi:hypothetical protein